MRTVSMMVLAALVACGGDDKNSDTDSLTLSAAPASLTIPQGGQGTVALTLSRTGHVVGAVVALAVTGLHDGVSAVFDNASTTADTATLTISASASAVQTTANIVVSAMADTIEGSTTVALTVGPPVAFDVHGTVVADGGIPGSGSLVTVFSADGSAGKQALTGDDGSFVIAGVRAPYDALVQQSNSNVLILGSVSAAPTYSIDFPNTSVDHSTQVTPTVSGAVGNSAIVVVHCPNSACATGVGAYTNACSYPLAATTPETCRASGTSWTQSGSSPYAVTGYSGYGETDVTITPHTNNTPNVSLAGPVASRTFNFTLSSTAPATAVGLIFDPLKPAAYYDMLLQQDAFPSGAGSIVVPDDSRVNMTVHFQVNTATAFASLTVDLSANNPTIVLPDSNIIVQPADGAHVNANTAIAFTPRQGAVFRFTFFTGGQSYEVRTATPLFNFGVLAAHGLNVAPATFQWGASSIEPYTVDEDLTLARQTVGALQLAPPSRNMTLD